MSEPRHGHTATLLHDGCVLVVGGYANGYTNGVELFDAESESWTKKAALRVPRDRHSATLLADGRVMVAGGFTATGATSSVEVYDPVADSWLDFPDMPETRAYHNALLLPENRLLVMAGENLENLASIIIFDLDRDAWIVTGALSTPHAYGQTATRLPNGQILIAGGEPNTSRPTSPALRIAERFDPKSGQCTKAADLHDPRYFHTATRLDDGRVLVAGGWAKREQYGPHATVEVYEPDRDRWLPLPPMSAARAYHAAVLLDTGHILVAGGMGKSGRTLASAESFRISD